MNLQNIGSELINKGSISTQKLIIVGVSGGPDSMCLLDLLVSAHIPVIAANFNHHLRAESGNDALFVKKAAQNYSIPLILGEENVAEFAKKQQMSIEESARFCRYHFLFDLARTQSAEAVAVAHNADDQVETVLMHLLRGAGLSGLKGMTYRSVLPEWDQDIPLIRPLLDTWRQEILDYCNLHHLQTVTDHSNMDITYFRNRLRHKLIPGLLDYNPQIKMAIWRMAQNLDSDYETLQEIVETNWKEVFVEIKSDAVILNSSLLISKKTGIQRNIMRKAILAIRPTLRDIDFGAIERAIGFMESPSRSGRMDLIDGIWLIKSGDHLIIGNPDSLILIEDWPQLKNGETIMCPLAGIMKLAEGWNLSFEIITPDLWNEKECDDTSQAWMDLDQIGERLIVRARLNGDVFRPLGMLGHHIKLSDYFINQHVPSDARKNYPLVCSDKEIIWVPGFRPAEACRVTPNTRRILHIELRKPK
jgi:tRNA(Ile)-lysidine synthase